MAYVWTARQFVGGTVALDFANTVCYRADPARRFDKIAEAAEFSAFAEAASRFSDAGPPVRRPAVASDSLGIALHKEIRESTDALFRPIATGKRPDTQAYRALLRMHQELLAGEGLRVGDAGLEIDPVGQPGFGLLLTQSALRLAASAELQRLRICPSCHWLFIDRSRNASRRWCDMLTCGNRAKAERHQRRHRVRLVTGKEPVGGLA
jgi:predicted RNA-binding Zn ribbon-like protein